MGVVYFPSYPLPKCWVLRMGMERMQGVLPRERKMLSFLFLGVCGMKGDPRTQCRIRDEGKEVK